MDALISRLFSVTDANVYAVLDGVSLKKNTPLFLEELGLDFACLYRGELAPDLAARAPYLIKLTPNSEFLQLWLDEGWGQHWGIFTVSYADMRIMRRHLRRFLRVRKPDSRIIYFRYYDPRILNAFLPVCNAEEFKTLLGPSLFYLTESEVDGKAHVYSCYKEKFHESFLSFTKQVEA